MNEAEYLTGLLNNTRVLAYFYLDKLSEADWFKQFDVNGARINSVAWNLAHMAWAENFLVLVSTGNNSVNIKWLELFKIGSEPAPINLYPNREDILSAFENIHTLAMHQVRSMKEEQFDEPNHINLKFKNGNSQRLAIHHHLRHEGTHIGHLALLAKMHGIQTI
ncbi:MAG: DinB family protein [Bacteroidota bacterium]|nr:DinB family protein [Bacteroidota bacterium]